MLGISKARSEEPPCSSCLRLWGLPSRWPYCEEAQGTSWKDQAGRESDAGLPSVVSGSLPFA